MKQWIWILFIFFVGCAVAPVQKTDLSNIHEGCSIKEVKKEIPVFPKVKNINTPMQLFNFFVLTKVVPNIYEAVKDDEKELEKLDELLSEVIERSKPEKQWTVLLYRNINEGIWFLFDGEDKLILQGEGGWEVVAYRLNCFFIDIGRINGFLTYVEAEERKAEKLLKLKIIKACPFVEEICKYRIMLAEKVDKKEITEKEFEYLKAQKMNEVRERIQAISCSRRRGLTRSQAAAIAIGTMGAGVERAFQSFADGYYRSYSPSYRGRLSNNPYLPDSTSNPYGRYGSPYSPDSINNPYGAGSPYRLDSPNNPYGTGLKIYGE